MYLKQFFFFNLNKIIKYEFKKIGKYQLIVRKFRKYLTFFQTKNF